MKEKRKKGKKKKGGIAKFLATLTRQPENNHAFNQRRLNSIPLSWFHCSLFFRIDPSNDERFSNFSCSGVAFFGDNACFYPPMVVHTPCRSPRLAPGYLAMHVEYILTILTIYHFPVNLVLCLLYMVCNGWKFWSTYACVAFVFLEALFSCPCSFPTYIFSQSEQPIA